MPENRNLLKKIAETSVFISLIVDPVTHAVVTLSTAKQNVQFLSLLL